MQLETCLHIAKRPEHSAIVQFVVCPVENCGNVRMTFVDEPAVSVVHHMVALPELLACHMKHAYKESERASRSASSVVAAELNPMRSPKKRSRISESQVSELQAKGGTASVVAAGHCLSEPNRKAISACHAKARFAGRAAVANCSTVPSRS